jgi:2,4-dienoyl-CoA reductase-like NADH-dependent reductase (Old Yellow Enzyme family)
MYPGMNATELLTGIERFLKRTGMGATGFGRQAVGDPNFVADLRAGREPRRQTTARAMEFILEHEVAKGRAA